MTIQEVWFDEEENCWKGKPEPGADLQKLRTALDEFQKQLVEKTA